MPNRLMANLASDFQTLTDQYETILNRCADEDRDPTEVEASTLEGLRSQMQPLGDRLVELRATDDRIMASRQAFANAPELPPSAPGSIVHVRSEPEVYRRDAHPAERFSFFRDLLHAQMDNDPEPRARLERHSMMLRAAGTTTTGTGIVPPTWLFEEFAIIAHGARPWADSLRSEERR